MARRWPAGRRGARRCGRVPRHAAAAVRRSAGSRRRDAGRGGGRRTAVRRDSRRRAAGLAPARRGRAAACRCRPGRQRRTFADLGIVGWFRARLGDAPVRPDRSATLVAERGGRLDRLDLWFLVVLVIATMTLRTFRLAEPYQMHFDEVYHARTAPSSSRTGATACPTTSTSGPTPTSPSTRWPRASSLWGQDDVSATSELGVPATASVVEPRREDAATPGQHAGERLHVATGTEIRTYDLVTRQLVSVVPAAGSSALAIDASTHQLVIGYNDGRIATLDLAPIGRRRRGRRPRARPTSARPITRSRTSSSPTTARPPSPHRPTA